MKFEWDGKIGLTFVSNSVTFLALVIAAAIGWTKMQDRQDVSDKKYEGVRTAITGLRGDLKASQAERQDQAQRLSRVETAVTFLASYFRGPPTFDHGSILPPGKPN